MNLSVVIESNRERLKMIDLKMRPSQQTNGSIWTGGKRYGKYLGTQIISFGGSNIAKLQDRAYITSPGVEGIRRMPRKQKGLDTKSRRRIREANKKLKRIEGELKGLAQVATLAPLPLDGGQITPLESTPKGGKDTN